MLGKRGTVLLVDILDFWSLLPVILSSNCKQEIRYLVTVRGWQGRLITGFLRLLGRSLLRQTSCFERDVPGFYREYNKLAMDFQLGYAAPHMKSQIAAQFELSNDEIDRLARYATIKAWGFLSRAFELLISASHDQPGVRINLLFQNSPVADALCQYASEFACTARPYSAPGRIFVPARAGYYSDRSRIGLGFIPTTAFAVNVFLRGTINWIMAALRVAIMKKDHGNDEQFDVLALAYQTTPSPGFNDLFWADKLRQMGGYRIFAVYANPLSDVAREFYMSKAQRLESLKDFRGLRSIVKSMLVPRRVAQHQMCGLGRAFRRAIRQIAQRRMPLWLSAILFQVESTSNLLEALMRTYGARISWAMLEGNDLTSLAMTLAAGRVGGTCLGTSWSMPYTARTNDSLARNHVVFVWGARQERIYVASSALPRRYVTVGYPTMFHYLRDSSLSDEAQKHPSWLCDALAKGARKHTVTFFDNICFTDAVISCTKLAALFHTLLNWVEQRPEVLLVIKTKRAGSPVLCGELGQRIDVLIEQGAVHVREEKADVQAGLVADAVVGISSATLALLAAAYGRNCVLYDQHDVMSEDTFPTGLRSVRRVSLLSELPLALDDALTKSADTGNRGGTIDEYADAQGCARVAHYMSEVLEAHRRGLTGVQAEEMAFRKYEQRWARQLNRL